MSKKLQQAIESAVKVVGSTNGRSTLGAALDAARKANAARAEGNEKTAEYHVVRKMWFTGKLTETGLRNYCTDVVTAAL